MDAGPIAFLFPRRHLTPASTNTETEIPKATSTHIKIPDTRMPGLIPAPSVAGIHSAQAPAAGDTPLSCDCESKEKPNTMISLAAVQNRENATSDLRLTISGEADVWNPPSPRNGALIMPVAEGSLSLADCQTPEGSLEIHEPKDIHIGNYFYGRTNRERLVFLTDVHLPNPDSAAGRNRFHSVIGQK